MDDGGSGADTIVLNAHGNSDFIAVPALRSLQTFGVFYNKVKVPKPPLSAASNIIEIIVIATAKTLHSIPQAPLLAIPWVPII